MKDEKKLPATGFSAVDAAISAVSLLAKDIPDNAYINASDPFLLARAKAENIGHLAATIIQTVQYRLSSEPAGYIAKENENCAFPCRKPAGK
ncbi:hypothetical protein ABIC71_004128 [Herbaspirillum seropedicae]|uniref:hypothetical protein n=1 Tax=Herbaspirillum seropedicae TaxID=964 RepID=UPI00339564BA